MDRDRVKDILVSLSLADHVGDVNNDLPRLAQALFLPEPEWDDRKRRFVWAWEDDDE